jgi:hypothetical protein
MSTTIHNCLHPLSRQLHTCHAIMAYQESTEPTVKLDTPTTIDAYVVHNQTGELKSPECQISLIGPAAVYLVASRFPNLYYIVQNERCTCPRGRVSECQHFERVELERCIAEDLVSHIEDTPMYGSVRSGTLVEVTWNELTAEEQRAAYNNTFAPCA